jgi:class 3 adenylate cyclase
MSSLDSPPPTDSTSSRARSTRATVLFADLVGFSKLAELVGPESAYLI